jgi:uncharacterized protein YcfL
MKKKTAKKAAPKKAAKKAVKKAAPKKAVKKAAPKKAAPLFPMQRLYSAVKRAFTEPAQKVYYKLYWYDTFGIERIETFKTEDAARKRIAKIQRTERFYQGHRLVKI